MPRFAHVRVLEDLRSPKAGGVSWQGVVRLLFVSTQPCAGRLLSTGFQGRARGFEPPGLDGARPISWTILGGERAWIALKVLAGEISDLPGGSPSSSGSQIGPSPRIG